MNINLHDPKLILSNRRIKFYEDKITLSGFDSLYQEHFPDSKETVFISKFDKLKEIISDLEVWAPMVILGPNGEIMTAWMNSVSTSGRVWGHYRDKEITPRIDDDGYSVGYVSRKYFTFHRAVLSTFGMDIPTDVDKQLLTVNHKNKIRRDNFLLNLEWMTHVENVRDGFKGVSKSLKITVVKNVIGIEENTVFYLPSRNHLYELGISTTKFKERCRNTPTYKGLKIEQVEDYVESIIPEKFITYFSKIIPV